MKPFKSSRIQITFAIAAALVLLLSVISYLRIIDLTKTSEGLNHTTLVQLQLNNIYISAYEAEADSRGYVLTRDDAYIERMRHNLFILDSQKVYLKTLIEHNFSQRQNFRKLDSILNRRVSFMKAIVVDAPKEKISMERWLEGRKIMADLRHQVDLMVTEETMHYKVTNRTFLYASGLTPIFTIFLTFVALLILVASYLIIVRELKISHQLSSELENSRMHLMESNQSLVEKNASLDAMNKELESFTYISSHDLQEPLRKIQTFISRIGEDKESQFSVASSSYLNRTQEAARRMQNLIQDLLAYSRVNKEVFAFESCDFRELISEVLEELSEEIENKGAVVSIKGNGKVNIVKVQFRQLLVNLLSNAVKFVSEGSIPRIVVKLDRSHQAVVGNQVFPGDFSRISIQDNGIGIEEQYQSRIFDVFQRLHSKDEYSGTGVGLAIVKKIVENHNGFIDLHSDLGKGTTFVVYLKN